MSPARKILIVVLSPVILLGAYLLGLLATDNFHAITPGEAYRSGVIGRHHLEEYINQYGIKSIVNLRGPYKKSEWYKDELSLSGKYGISHYDLKLDDASEPTPEQAAELVQIITTAPRPVLFHCYHGADRSGLAAAMWKVLIDNEPASDASGQLSIRYGHIPVGKTTAMDRFFADWAANRRQCPH